MSKKPTFSPKVDVSKGLQIDDQLVKPGQHGLVRINAGKLPSDNRINVFAHVFNSGIPGPVLLVLGGIHGDEINGIETVRRSVEHRFYDNLKRGAVVVIPLLNVYGFINFSREVSDGKDVNRSFPGHLSGSLASRVARIVTLKILPVIDAALDFHTGGSERYNYPQVRYNPADIRASLIAEAFGAPVRMEHKLIPNSFRKAASDHDVAAVVYEAGESVRLDQFSIDFGLRGIHNVMAFLGLKEEELDPHRHTSYIVEKSSWLRANMAGMFLWYKKSGDVLRKNEIAGIINDPYGTKSQEVVAKSDGLIIGHNNASVVNLGDPLFHLGTSYRVLNPKSGPTF
jgi:predicted deacylase